MVALGRELRANAGESSAKRVEVRGRRHERRLGGAPLLRLVLPPDGEGGGAHGRAAQERCGDDRPHDPRRPVPRPHDGGGPARLLGEWPGHRVALLREPAIPF